MKKTVLAVFCLSASLAWAQDNDEADSEEVKKVDLRVSVIENINVTAEKPPVEAADEEDIEIESILDEAESLDNDN
jgi:hypothetical protein